MNFNGVSVDSMEKPSSLIKASKTDPFQQGAVIFVGRTGNKLCPVAATVQGGPAWSRSTA